MRVPFSLLFVGWWTAGQRWMVIGQWYSKPSISVSPEVVTLGGNVTVRCSNASHPDARFFLYKDPSSASPLQSQTTKDYEAEFIISNTKIPDAGFYRCLYRFESGSDARESHFSDAVPINVADPSIPKPSIKVKPRYQYALHSNVILECQGQGEDLNFSLRKAKTREESQVVAGATDKATFHFHLVKMEDAGSYVCQYHHESTPFVWSVPSDPVDLIWKDPSLFKPTIKVKPKDQHNEGKKVTFKCEGSDEEGLDFFLHRSQNLTVLKMKAKDGTAKFFLHALRREDAGNYTCQYCYRENPNVCSEPSNSVQVIVTDKSQGNLPTIIWTSVAAGLLLVLLLLVLILVLCKKRKKRSTVNEGNQPVHGLLEQNAGADTGDREDHDGVTYAVLNHHSLKMKQPASQPPGPESCVYASVAKEKTRKV